MAEDTASKMEFPLEITEKYYIKGSLIVERRVGTLRSTLPVLIFGTVVLTIGLFSFSWFSSWLVPLVLCAFGPLLVLFFFVTEPAAVRKKARQNYPVFQKFMKDARLYLYPDNMRVQAERVVINESYAYYLRMMRKVKTMLEQKMDTLPLVDRAHYEAMLFAVQQLLGEHEEKLNEL